MTTVQAAPIMTTDVTKDDAPDSVSLRDRLAYAVDTASDRCAVLPGVERWWAEHERREELRTDDNRTKLVAARRARTGAQRNVAASKRALESAKAKSKPVINLFNREVRYARHDLKDARGTAKFSRKDVAVAKKAYPETMIKRTAQANLAADCAMVAAGVLASGDVTNGLAIGGTAGVVAALVQAGVLLLGRRGLARLGEEPATVPDADALTPNAEESRLLNRLDPQWWTDNAPGRGLADTVPIAVKLTPSGITAKVQLDGKWDADKLRGAEGSIRALLGVKTATKVEIRPGKTGDIARITIRTRSQADGVELVWTPQSVGIGLDETTGEPVVLPIGVPHALFAGATGMGKSTSWRPLMMAVVADPAWAGILLDPKIQEARLWQGKIRTEGHQRDPEAGERAIYDAVVELYEEMLYRQSIAETTKWVGTPEHPELFVVIEEGAAIVRMAKRKVKEEDENGKVIESKPYADVLDKIDALYTLGRSVGLKFNWATQFPSKEAGIPPMVTENTMTTVGLTVSSPLSDRVVFGENAQATGWEPSKLGGVPGRALVQHGDRKPSPVRIWYVSDETIRALPDAEPWRHGKAPQPSAPESKEPASPHPVQGQEGGEQLGQGAAALDAPAAPTMGVGPEDSGASGSAAPLTAAEEVKAILRAEGRPMTRTEVVGRASASRARIYAAMAAGVESGAIRAHSDGRLEAA